jgi:DNA repair protein RecN (Recombination protein N)
LAKARRKAAKDLAALRAKAGSGFASALAAAVSDLAMASAEFEVQIKELAEDAWGPWASCGYEILYKPGPKATARPLAKIASGGELSRVMLAIKTLQHSDDAVGTLVFDEIDAGIGGATAGAVANRLQELAGHHQVIVVTHLAQIAAVADAQWLVSKGIQNADGALASNIQPLDQQARVAEIARMLSGDTSKLSLEHARQMLEQAA